MSAAGDELDSLLVLMQRLRDPVQGCPWDREQSFASIAPFTIEEAYEVADAIARQSPVRLRDELGDLLFQVVFHAQMAQERGWFDFAAVAAGIRTKLVRRHPHVFGAAQPAEGNTQLPDGNAQPGDGRARRPDLSDLHQAWEAQKARERAEAGAHGVLADVPQALPALARAAKLGRRAARVGFDWSDAAGVRAKIDEELAEVAAAHASGDREHTAEEIGDLLFAIANWARHLNVDPEDSLRRAAGKFERRFQIMEQLAATRGLALGALSEAQWDELWRAAKRQDP
jgi:ATP diphosphatase